MIDVDTLISERFNSPIKKHQPLKKVTTSLLKKLVHQNEVNHFIETNQHLIGFEFNDAVLEHFDFTFRVSSKDRLNIPDQGRVIIVANHPLGSLDGLALLKMVSEIRRDVRIVTTPLLGQIEPLQSLFLPVDNLSSASNHRQNLRVMTQALEAEQAVIMFPTGEVSRIRPNGVRDTHWKTGFLHLAKRTEAPIVPIHIDGKNSSLFYGLSSIYKPLGTMMLVKEMFNKKGQEISFRIGKPIPWQSIAELNLSRDEIAKRMRKQVYLLGKKSKSELFNTIENITHPAKTKQIRSELRRSQLIGQTQDGMKIYLFDYIPNSSVMHEIGRLRELAFREVQEGTGNTRDLDRFDRYYRHLILWDEHELEIVGSYRIGEGKKILEAKGHAGLYSNSLFKFNPQFYRYIEQGIELGRSFIQPRYQGRRSLDYLWYGIGAYLRQHPEIKYMFGPVSLSASYPLTTQKMIASFYTELFGDYQSLAEAVNPFYFSADQEFIPFNGTVDEAHYKEAFTLLKDRLSDFGVRVPTLYKQYVELCRPGGCQFIGFNIDPDFSNCVDALVLVEISQINIKKRQRYIESHYSTFINK